MTFKLNPFSQNLVFWKTLVWSLFVSVGKCYWKLEGYIKNIIWNCFQEANWKEPTGFKKEVTSWKQKESGYPRGCVPSDDIYLAPYSRSKMLVSYKGCTLVMLLMSLYLYWVSFFHVNLEYHSGKFWMFAVWSDKCQIYRKILE